MLAQIACAALLGIDAHRVNLEVDFSHQGMPGFTMVGLAEGAVRESKERVFTALKNSGFHLPPARITVNLAPADMRKEGSAYDLPLAAGLLVGNGNLPQEALEGWFLAGEVSLDGTLKPVPGILPLAIKAWDEGAKGLLVAPENAAEASVVKGLPVYAPKNLVEAIHFLEGVQELTPWQTDHQKMWADQGTYHIDFSDVCGQEHAKRAIEIAAAGGHNLLFLGPPGSGKTMLASRLPTVLPALAFDEALEVTKIYSVAGLLEGVPLMVKRPFRSPHHTISDAGLIGGGAYPKPGEVSLAHRGVLFLDELPEFKKHVLEVLRQPLEAGKVTIARAAMSLTYPADVMLVAAMNPCPCGYLGDEKHRCTCSPNQVSSYRNKVSGPMLDRIDLHVQVPAVPYKDLKGATKGADSATMRKNINRAREVQKIRYNQTLVRVNADLSGELLQKYCALDKAGHEFLEKAVNSLGLSARAYTRILRIARTIVDLTADAEEDFKPIGVPELAEAVNYRSLDRL